MKSIVITGSTSGIGYGLADSFLNLGCSVSISGRSKRNVKNAISKLSEQHDANHIFGFTCDVTNYSQVQDLWNNAKSHFGKIDIWINNAGIAHPETEIYNYAQEKIKQVIEVNIIGVIHGSIVALQGMKEQGFGSIYNTEGLGSDGRIIKGMTLYGMSKSAIGYLTKAMASEVQGTSILVGGIRPGMVVTKLITEQYEGQPEKWERVKKIFNALSDRVDTITPWLARKILANNKNGTTITWLSRGKIAKRFLTMPFNKRIVFD